MSLYGVLRTGVSGMTAQSNKLGTVADNIANSNTTGYKRASTEFSSLILDSGKGDYNSGSVTTTVRYAISKQGPVQYTTSVTDLAVQGNGFFVVSGSSDGASKYMTRAGNFVPDDNGYLVNSAGYYLMGAMPVNGKMPGAGDITEASLQVVQLPGKSQKASGSTQGNLKANLPAGAAVVPPGIHPTDNVAGSTYTAKSSLVAYDQQGAKVTFDVYYTKIGPNQWQVAVFDQAYANPTTGFPYAPGGMLGAAALNFDASGNLVGPSPTINLVGGVSAPRLSPGQTLALTFNGMQQLAADYAPYDAVVDGNAPGDFDRVEIGKDGIMYTVYTNGTRLATARIPLADVRSPDNLMPLPGNVYSPSINSGDWIFGIPGKGGLGTIASSALEQSNVDLATELTGMIEAQRGYTANSKVFQTGSELLDVLMSLKR